MMNSYYFDNLNIPITEEEEEEWDVRMNHIGQNGNTGEHYDTVEKPQHYASGDVECIDAIKAAMTPEEFKGYLKGNVFKYVWRERQKGGEESLRKARWYLTRLTNISE
jgi:hypothetical protein